MAVFFQAQNAKASLLRDMADPNKLVAASGGGHLSRPVSSTTQRPGSSTKQIRPTSVRRLSWPTLCMCMCLFSMPTVVELV
jgi:hypothetical protein